MDSVQLLVQVPGGEQWKLAFSRVPVVGEQIRIDGETYVVRNVIHTPNASYSAELAIAMVSAKV
jgi:hypothetical protein